ncbi:MAG TPA: D-ribose pyranase [Peptococcaceae bacterium]|nr:D-ribose pyranase [Peptococcaceae bacterium]
MKKTGILNKDISEVIAGLGHTDTIAIGDAGLPIQDGPRRIDLAVSPGIPLFFDVLKAVLSEMEVQKITIASEMKDISPDVYKRIIEMFMDIEVEMIPHSELKKRLVSTKAVIRTGEFTPYSNIILESGVIF